MQIADDSAWLQIVFAAALTVLGGSWVYLQRQMGRLRAITDKHAEQINVNTRDIAVNSAIRQELADRHKEMMGEFRALEQTITYGFERRDQDLKTGLEKMDDKLKGAEDKLHTRINDLRDLRYSKGGNGD